MILDNGSAVMDIQKAFSNGSDETGIMLVSLQYESGDSIKVIANDPYKNASLTRKVV